MNETIKQRLTEEIRSSNLSVKDLAKAVGVSPEMITQYCTTKKLPRLDTFAAICKALNVSADYLLGLRDFE